MRWDSGACERERLAERVRQRVKDPHLVFEKESLATIPQEEKLLSDTARRWTIFRGGPVLAKEPRSRSLVGGRCGLCIRLRPYD